MIKIKDFEAKTTHGGTIISNRIIVHQSEIDGSLVISEIDGDQIKMVNIQQDQVCHLADMIRKLV